MLEDLKVAAILRSTILSFPRLDKARINEVLMYDPSAVLLTELHKILREELNEKIPVLESLFSQKQYLEVSKLAHRLKSTCNNSGASRLGEILRQIELHCREEMKNLSESAELVGCLKSESEFVLSDIHNFNIESGRTDA